MIGSEIAQAPTHENTCECVSTLKQNVCSSEKYIESISWTEMVQPQSFFYVSPCQQIESILHEMTFKNKRMSITLKLQNMRFCIRDVSTLGFSISDRRESHCAFETRRGETMTSNDIEIWRQSGCLIVFIQSIVCCCNFKMCLLLANICDFACMHCDANLSNLSVFQIKHF